MSGVRWPLPEVPPALPAAGDPGAFGAVRRHDVHTGVDLHCPEGSLVVAIEPGVVAAVLAFTGSGAGSPWWNDTDAVLVEGSSGVVVYGEVRAAADVRVGTRVSAGDPLGRVVRVLRHDKGRPMSMLHVELYAAGVRDPVWWRLGEPMPAGLCDPTPLLAQSSSS